MIAPSATPKWTRQHLRGIAGGLEHGLRNTWWIVDTTARASDAVVRRRLWKIRIHVRISAGTCDREIRPAACRRRSRPGGEALKRWIDGCPNQMYPRCAFRRRRVPEAFARRHRDQGAGLAIDRPGSRRGVARLDVQSGGTTWQHDQAFEAIRSRPAGLLHRLYHQALACRSGPQGTIIRLMTRRRWKNGARRRTSSGREWEKFEGLSQAPKELEPSSPAAPFNARAAAGHGARDRRPQQLSFKPRRDVDPQGFWPRAQRARARR